MSAMLDGVPLGCAVGTLLGDSVGAMLDGVPLGCAVSVLMIDSVELMMDYVLLAVRYWETPWKRCWMASRWAAQSVRLRESDAGWRSAG